MIAAMKLVGIFAGGIAALGLGFAAGSWTSVGTNRRSPGDTPPGEAITFRGNGGSTESRGEGLPRSGSFVVHSSYGEARERLEELLASDRRLTMYERHYTPIVSERILEEVEGVFALAKAGDLTAFIAGFEGDEEDHPILGLAFAALARISPPQAAEAFLARWRVGQAGNDRHPGLVEVVREWERRDSLAAERWIASLEDDALRKAARQTFLTMKAGSDPSAALADLAEIDPDKGYGFATILGETLDLRRLPEVAQRFLEARDDGSNSAAMLPSLLSAWGARDAESMADWLLNQDLEAIGADFVQQSLYGLVATDPEGFLERIAPELPTQPMLGRIAGQAWWGLLVDEGKEASAMKWLGENIESASGFGGWEIADHFAKRGDWTPAKTERILAELAKLPPSDALAAFSHDFLERLSRYQPKAVLDFALDRLPLGSRADHTLAMAVGNWASSDPEAAIRWSLENLESEEARSQGLRFAISKWGAKDPRAAAATAMAFPEKERASAFGGLALQWAEKDPESVLSYLRESSDPEAVSSLTRNSFRRFSERNRGPAYIQEALAMPPGKMRHDAVRGLFEGWALSDLKAGVEAMERVPEGSLRNAAIQGFNGFAIRSDPGLAIELATRISVPATRERELVSRGRAWLRANPEAAKAAIRGNPAIPESVKGEILK